MDKFNAWRLINLMESECAKLELAIKQASNVRELKKYLLELQKQLQNEIEAK